MNFSDEEIFTYIKNAYSAPRLNQLMLDFSDLATGEKGAPHTLVKLNPSLLNDHKCLNFSETRSKYAGVFNEHFVASIPYILEEQCRFGAAVADYAEYIQKMYGSHCNIYTLGDGPGVMARSLSAYSGGEIHTLTCSPTPENFREFYANNPNQSSYFYLGPFFEVTKESLINRNILGFEHGFDIIIEDTTFQMYGNSRQIPIYLANRNLKKDGLFVFFEKFLHSDVQEFFKREKQKDEEFKNRYFSKDQIEEKKISIVKTMDKNLVTIEEMTKTLSSFFSYAAITWNSGNFSTIVASNNLTHLNKFINLMTPPAIPSNFSDIDSPKILLGNGISIKFRTCLVG